MTMIPAPQNLSRQHCYGGGGGGGGGGGCGCSGSYSEGLSLMSRLQSGYDSYCYYSNCSSEANCLGPEDLVVVNGPTKIMAEEDESAGTESTTVNEAAASSSRDVHHQDDADDDEGWLQLSIGGHPPTTTSQNSKHPHAPAQLQHDHHRIQSSRKDEQLVELNLLPPASATTSTSPQQGRLSLAPRFDVRPDGEFQTTSARPPLMPNITSSTTTTHRQYYGYGTPLLLHHTAGNISAFPHRQDQINWIYRPPAMALSGQPNISALAASPSSSSFMSPAGAYFARPFQQLHGGINMPAAPDVDFRVLNPPRRPHSGVWFMLQASQNQNKEPFLPQIPKSYLRIKDGRMTIGLVIKYLVNKLNLENESEVEIRCRGQQLQPLLTLQHVRDNIWSLRRDAFTTLLPADASAADHVMVLHYGRTS